MKLKSYLYLMRLHKPIGILLLLWPTLWALWVAGAGAPNFKIVIIFIAGVILMRAAGCVINDIADRNIDPYVERTRHRPLATREISMRSACVLFVMLCLCALLLVLQLNRFTILLAFVGAALTVVYPFMKRYTHLPQFGLGLAFAWGVPMAFAAQMQIIPLSGWLLFSAAVIWPVIYDTMYAMVDAPDDIKIGVKSTALLLGRATSRILLLLQIVFLAILIGVGCVFGLKWPFFLSLGLAAILFVYQLYLIKDHDRARCFNAFLNNHWVGLIIFLGIVVSYLL